MIFPVAILPIYIAAVSLLIYGFSKIKTASFGESKTGITPKTTFTIIVPFRNESENLPTLLDSFSKLIYPKDLFEVILVDDNSDESFSVENLPFSIRNIPNNRLSYSPKKDAIKTAIGLAENQWIVTTDADCIVPENWLASLDAFICRTNAAMIAGAVSYNTQDNFLHYFQQLDLMSLQGATIGSFGINRPFMCNGANFAYTKSLFTKLNGFEGNEKFAGGDDVFLLQKAVAGSPEKVFYLKSEANAVRTKPLDSWKAVFHQRVRWASKTKGYQSHFGKLLGLIVLMGNLCWILGIGSLVFDFSPLVALVLILKPVIDFVLIEKASRFLRIKTHYYFPVCILYPFFSTVVALYSLFGKYEWKTRRY